MGKNQNPVPGINIPDPQHWLPAIYQNGTFRDIVLFQIITLFQFYATLGELSKLVLRNPNYFWCGVAQLKFGVAQLVVRRGSVGCAAWLSWLCGVAQLVVLRGSVGVRRGSVRVRRGSVVCAAWLSW
jgi:hypothetical protein